MNSTFARRVLAAGGLGLILGAGAPAFAQHSGGGHGGGGHSGGHVSGGAHFSGGSRGDGGHFSGVAHVSSYRGAPASRGAAGYRGAVAGAASYHVAGRGSYGYPGGYFGGAHYGYSTGAYWHGGYWRGGFWPGAYYGPGFAWFLPILPAAYATYWWGGIPYYYANDVYYTWNPGYDGYVATDPPPVADQSGAETPAPAPAVAGPDAAGSAQVFMYPKNGQSPEQQSTDRRECQQWAASQVGAGGENAPDYRRALVACVEGRGYSAN